MRCLQRTIVCLLVAAPLVVVRVDVARAVDLLDSKLTESSGLGFSNRRDNRVWTHNDSGGKAKLFAFDSKSGKRTGRCILKKMDAIDWEAMATFVDTRGKPQVIVADCGDNLAKRKQISLHLFAEPDPNEDIDLSPKDVVTLRVRHPGGPVDCEAVAVDPHAGIVVLVSKGKFPIARVETLPLSAFDTPQRVAMTTLVATLPLPMITGADINPTSGDLILASYFGLLKFSKPQSDSDLFAQLRGTPVTIAAPGIRQLEAVAFDKRGAAWVTSEGKAVLKRVSN